MSRLVSFDGPLHGPRLSRRSLLSAAAALSALAVLPGVAAGPASFDPLVQPAPLRLQPERAVLLSVARAGDRLVAVGEAGLVVVSDDHGQSWRQVPVPVGVTLTKVAFVSPSLGWAVGHGGVILQSRDGGLGWRLQLDGRQAAELTLTAAQREVEALSAGDDEGPLARAARQRLDTARRWVADGPDKPLLDIHFFDERTGLAVGAYGLALLTRDGGTHWESALERIDNPRGLHLYHLLATPFAVFIAGEQGLLLRAEPTDTRQVGAALLAFSEVSSPYVGTYFDMLALPDGGLLLLGLRGHAFHSRDAGTSWQRLELGTEASFGAGIWLTSPDSGSLVIADDSGRLLRSFDAGGAFTPLANPEPFAVAGLAQSGDGALIVAGAGGLLRVPLAQGSMESHS